MRISDEILKRNSDTYRRIRNAARFLLQSNLGDFNPDEDMIEYDEMLLLDQWIIDRLGNVNEQIKDDFERYSFHEEFHKRCIIFVLMIWAGFI